jgi:acetyl esterase/lipase
MSEATIDSTGRLLLPARSIPVPSTISGAAQRALTAPPFGPEQWPALTDVAGWKRHSAERDALIADLLRARLPPFSGRVAEQALSDARLYEIVADPPESHRQRALLYVHGGAFIFGGGSLAMRAAQPYASLTGWTVYAIDYRMPPDHPYPAALDDTLEAYRYVIGRYAPGQVAVLGFSAGAGLAAAAILKARDSGLPLPAAAVLLTPEADLTESGDTFETNRDIDVVLRQRLTPSIALYANGHDLRSPYLSPVYGDFSRGFPPTYLQSGTRDLFLSNTVRLHRALRRAGQTAELHVFEAMPHGGFFGAPEDQEAMSEQLRFLERCLCGN